MHDNGSNESAQIAVTARVLVVSGDRLLLVSNDGSYWYTPGGCLEPGEDLPTCARREVQEETGLHIDELELLHVTEFFEIARNRHKVECYFRTSVDSPELERNWNDDAGPVQQRRFFTLEQMRETVEVQPRFLERGTWLGVSGQNRVYLGTD